VLPPGQHERPRIARASWPDDADVRAVADRAGTVRPVLDSLSAAAVAVPEEAPDRLGPEDAPLNLAVPCTVVYDAKVFYPAPLRDLLIRLAQTSLVRVRWTERIVDESFRNLRRIGPTSTPCVSSRPGGSSTKPFATASSPATSP
jgi:hypothetical protein